MTEKKQAEKQVFTEVLSKKELINGYHERTGKKKYESEATLESVFAYLEDIVYAQNKGFKLGDIGTVKVQVVPEREHGVPKSDKKVTKPKHLKPKFQVNKGFQRDLAALEVEEG